jgi:glycosyltransferase involved in cell wall biosynthesis
MNIVQITPGAGGMYCGNCFRDNALVAALRRLGHPVLMIPLYLPLTLDESDQSADTPIFFSGINVYLEQKSAWYRKAPAWLHRLFTSRRVLGWAAGRAAKTRPDDVGDLALSMLRGEEGNQVRELDDLIAWLGTQSKPDVICLSNALLIGMARRLRKDLGVPVVCMLQGEDGFLDGLPGNFRTQCWETLAGRARDVALFISTSTYFGGLMRERLNLAPERIRVVHNGILLDGYENPGARRSLGAATSEGRGAPNGPEVSSQSGVAAAGDSRAPVVGYFARMCREKGLDALVEAYVLLRQRAKVPNVKLRIGGACGPGDEALVRSLRKRLEEKNLLHEVEFHPNLDRAAKLAFLKSLTVFSVPAVCNEAFGLYVIEALAAGVPVVQPRAAAFPEIVAATGGGVLCEPRNPASLAEQLEALLLDPARARALGEAGRRAVLEKFSDTAMAKATLRVFAEVANPPVAP